jgi:hypothetical protein
MAARSDSYARTGTVPAQDGRLGGLGGCCASPRHAAPRGGFSRLFPRPAYQDGVAGIGATRGVPDVAADADRDTGMAGAVSDGVTITGHRAAPGWDPVTGRGKPQRPGARPAARPLGQRPAGS